MELKKPLTVFLESLRKHHRHSQRTMADLLGISRVSYANKEQCRKTESGKMASFTLEEVAEIKKQFNLTDEQIVKYFLLGGK